MSELYQNRLISEDDLSCLSHRHFMMEYSSRHWLDSLVHIQSSKSADVRARTFATLRSYSLTEVVEDTQVETVYGQTCMFGLFPLVCIYMHNQCNLYNICDSQS